MRRLLLTLALVAALADCGGNVLPYEVETDSGCLLYTPTGSGYCSVSPCDAGVIDSSPNPNLANVAIVKCGD